MRPSDSRAARAQLRMPSLPALPRLPACLPARHAAARPTLTPRPPARRAGQDCAGEQRGHRHPQHDGQQQQRGGVGGARHHFLLLPLWRVCAARQPQPLRPRCARALLGVVQTGSGRALSMGILAPAGHVPTGGQPRRGGCAQAPGEQQAGCGCGAASRRGSAGAASGCCRGPAEPGPRVCAPGWSAPSTVRHCVAALPASLPPAPPPQSLCPPRSAASRPPSRSGPRPPSATSR